MRSRILLCALIVAGLGDRLDACELSAHYRGPSLANAGPGKPNREAVRVVGVVSGYGAVTGRLRNLPNLGAAATVRIQVEEIVSGDIPKTETEVAVLDVRSDCSSIGTSREALAQRYPLGTRVAVLGEAIPGFAIPKNNAVLAEIKDGGFVEPLPRNVGRIETGELDFRKSYREVSSRVLDFEFDRALLALAKAPANERFARLWNLADYPYSYHAFRNADRELFAQIVAQGGITGSEAVRLLERFDDDEGRLRER